MSNLATSHEILVAIQKRIHLMELEWGFCESESLLGYSTLELARAFGRYRELVELRDAIQHPRYLTGVYAISKADIE